MNGDKMQQLSALVELFFPAVSSLGQFTEANAEGVPDFARRLLAHNSHMTAVLEAAHQSPMTVEVLGVAAEGDHYWRQIILRRSTDQRTVQFAIIRLDFQYIDPTVRREIEQQGAPLGKILIDHNVLRNVVMLSLWRIEPTDVLRERLELPSLATLYGRTAIIQCNGAPAIELLEIPTAVCSPEASRARPSSPAAT
jgi:chorismate-pyruvate lyase